MSSKKVAAKKVAAKKVAAKKVAAKKVAAKKARERVGSVVELALRLGVNRRTISRWRREHPADYPVTHSNGQHDVDSWREFIAKHGLRVEAEDDEEEEDDGSLEDINTLKRKHEKVKIEERQFKLETNRGDYLPIGDVREAWTKNVSQAVSTLRSRLENELPPILAGLDAPDIRRELQRVVDEFAEEMHDGPADEQIRSAEEKREAFARSRESDGGE